MRAQTGTQFHQENTREIGPAVIAGSYKMARGCSPAWTMAKKGHVPVKQVRMERFLLIF